MGASGSTGILRTDGPVILVETIRVYRSLLERVSVAGSHPQVSEQLLAEMVDEAKSETCYRVHELEGLDRVVDYVCQEFGFERIEPIVYDDRS